MDGPKVQSRSRNADDEEVGAGEEKLGQQKRRKRGRRVISRCESAFMAVPFGKS